MLIFFENDVFSEWSNRHFGRSSNQNVLDFNFLKKILWTLHFVPLSLSWENKKVKRYLKFSFYYYQSFSRISERKWEIVRSPLYHKWSAQLDNLFRPNINSVKSGQLCYQGKIPFWTYLTLPLNSKIGPDYSYSVLVWLIWLWLGLKLASVPADPCVYYLAAYILNETRKLLIF